MVRQNISALKNRRRIRDLANLVFASQEDACVWLRQPVRELDKAKPIDLIGTKTGVRCVEELLISISKETLRVLKTTA